MGFHRACWKQQELCLAKLCPFHTVCSAQLHVLQMWFCENPEYTLILYHAKVGTFYSGIKQIINKIVWKTGYEKKVKNRGFFLLYSKKYTSFLHSDHFHFPHGSSRFLNFHVEDHWKQNTEFHFWTMTFSLDFWSTCVLSWLLYEIIVQYFIS